VIIVDCPLCEAPAPFHPDTSTLECEACAVQLELADDPAAVRLAAAA
jgi:primosomal protein N'